MRRNSSTSITIPVATKILLVVAGFISMNAHGMAPADFGAWSADSVGVISSSDIPACYISNQDKSYLLPNLHTSD